MNRDQYNSYMAAYMKERTARRRERAIIQLGGKCVVCGSTEDLEFDHKNPDDKDPRCNSGYMFTFSERRLQAELAKCQLLCHDCHLEKTSSEASVEHGGGLSGKKNCPCVPCKERKAEYMRTHF
jgi:5-methylcytosine-specific restriction endonuclease McrA